MSLAFMNSLAFALTFLTSSASALPIIPVHSSGRQSVAVCLVAALILGLLGLVLLKRVYIKKRRVTVSQLQQNSVLSLPTSAVSADSVASQHEKTGFIVGFFGSPTVEIQCALEKAECKEHKQSSFTYQIHADSRRRRSDYPSVLDISRTSNYLDSTSPHAPESIKRHALRESHSFQLPSFPDKVHSIPPHPRRFSLPAMNRSVAHDSQRRRHSSLKTARSRRSVASASGSPSLRVDNPGFDQTPPPLSPQSSDVSSPSPTSSPISVSQPFSPKFGARLSRSFIPPLPPFSFTNLPSATQRTGPIQISHPYALSSHPRKNVQTSPLSRTDPKFAVQMRPSNLELPVPDPSLSPTLSSFPFPPPTTSILKPKLKVRTRRSPVIGPIGPSPLRSMILPESTDGELSSYGEIRLRNGEHSFTKDRPVSAQSPYTSLDRAMRASEIGSGASGTYVQIAKSTTKNLVPKAKRRHSSVSSPGASKADEDDPSVLLGIIRELVEETSEWDPSTVFMSQNFKALLQESGIASTKSADRVAADVRSAEETSAFTSDQSTQSTEIDVGLLGLELFSSESFYDATPHKLDYSANLWDEDSGEREIIGVAW
ncbi:hypothetical protein C8R43DRAFT_1117463 [Mycena crocata]|nr:hypothetical protein C8R43DRAFT_1117463 [Mycena crocata]